MNTLRVTSGLILIGCVFLTIRCTPPMAGNSSQTPNATVIGVLYQPDGKTPASGVVVHIRPKKSLADTAGFGGLSKRLAAIDSIVTDSTGRFAFDTSLDTGTYVITSASGNDAVLIDSVVVNNRTLTDSLPPDTLKPAGALKGIIKLSEGGDPRKVFVLAFGIDRFARVETDGRFRFQNLAEAAYDLRIISSLDNYGVLDTVNIPVKSADTTNLDTIDLPFTGIPTPKNVFIAYDTLKQIVTLSWNKASPTLVSGYYVYRRNVDSNTVLTRTNTSPITDTLYRDSTGVQDQTYEYRVSAIDKNATEGTKSAGVSVKVVGAFTLAKTFSAPDGGGTNKIINKLRKLTNTKLIGVNDYEVLILDTSFNIIRRWGSEGYDSLQFNGIKDIALDMSDYIYISDCGNNRIQKFDTLGNLLRTWGNFGSSQGQFSCPSYIEIDTSNRVFVCDVPGNNLSRIQIFDSTGNYLGSFAQNGSGNGQFNLITGIAIDDKGHLFIADVNNERIENISIEGSFLNNWVGLTPENLFYGKNALVFSTIENDGTHPIYIYNSEASFIAKSILGTPIGVIDNLIYVRTETANHLKVIIAYRFPKI